MATLPNPLRSWVMADTQSVAQQGTATITGKRVIRLLLAQFRVEGFTTHRFSCDSVTAGTAGDGVDRWVADGSLIGNTPGNAHSWSVDLWSDGMGQTCVDLDTTAAGGGSIFWSPAAGFTGGTTTARPTATDEIEISTSTLLGTTNGTWTWFMLRTDDAGVEGTRVFLHNSALAGGPTAVFSFEHAETQLSIASWADPVVASWLSPGTAAAGARTQWEGTGHRAFIGGVNRQLLAEALVTQSALDPDGDRLLEPVGLTSVAIGDVGFLADWYFATGSVTDGTPYSDATAPRGYMTFDEVVSVWDRTTDRGVANVPGAKLRLLYEASGDVVPPVVTILSPTPGLPPGDPGAFSSSISIAKNTPIRVRVIDPSPGIRLLVLHCRITTTAEVKAERLAAGLPDWRGTLVAYDGDGGGLQDPFDGPGNVVTGISGGLELDLLIDEGWPKGANVTFGVRAVDAAGNLE